MSSKAVFAGLVFDENDQPCEVAYVGPEACYVINDAGFRRHIASETVDRQVLALMKEQITGNEGLISEQAAKMLGSEDIFSRAMIENQLKNMDQQLDLIIQSGIPEDSRTYLGMVGFKVVIDLHGGVIRVDQPGAISPDEE
jgi:hypothetical protein